MKKILSVMLGLGFACAATASLIVGDVVYVDFGALEAEGNYNQISSTSLSVADAIDFANGEATGVGISVASSGTEKPFLDAANAVAGNELSTTDENLYSDMLAINNGGATALMTITITGLDTSLAYDLIGGYAAVNSGNEEKYQTVWTVDGDSVSSDATAAAGYLSFTGLTAAADGSLTITLDRGNKNHIAVSQMTLTAVAVPEPATLGMVGLGAVALMFARRRLRR